MALLTLQKIILLAFACMYVTGEETENPTIESCPASSSVADASSVVKYTCSDDPAYIVGTRATAGSSTMIVESNGEFTVSTLFDNLVLTATPDCGVDLTAPVTCNGLIIQFGSKAGGMDGSAMKVGDMGADGLAKWMCQDSTTSMTMNYYFAISFTADAAMAADTVIQLNARVGAPMTTTADFDPMTFAKFSAVEAETEIYLLKESDTIYHTLFVSDDTMIKFKDTQYNDIFGADEKAGNAVTAASVCDNVVQLCFGDACKDGAMTLSLGILMAFIPFIVNLFN